MYAHCLIKYFDTSRSVGQVTMPDLQKALGDLQQSFLDDVSDETLLVIHNLEMEILNLQLENTLQCFG